MQADSYAWHKQFPIEQRVIVWVEVPVPRSADVFAVSNFSLSARFAVFTQQTLSRSFDCFDFKQHPASSADCVLFHSAKFRAFRAFGKSLTL